MFTLIVLSAVTVMIIVTFIFWGIGPKSNPTEAVLAQVEKERVTVEEFWRAYDNEYKRAKDTAASEDEIKKLNLKDRVLELLVDRKVLLIAAEKAGLNVTEKELQDAIINTPYFQRNGVFDKTVYERALSMNHMTPQGFETILRNDMVINKMVKLIGETAELTAEEIKMLDSLSGGNQEQLQEIFRSSKSNMALKAYIEGFKRQLNIKINKDLIA